MKQSNQAQIDEIKALLAQHSAEMKELLFQVNQQTAEAKELMTQTRDILSQVNQQMTEVKEQKAQTLQKVDDLSIQLTNTSKEVTELNGKVEQVLQNENEQTVKIHSLQAEFKESQEILTKKQKVRLSFAFKYGVFPTCFAISSMQTAFSNITYLDGSWKIKLPNFVVLIVLGVVALWHGGKRMNRHMERVNMMTQKELEDNMTNWVAFIFIITSVGAAVIQHFIELCFGW